MTKEQFNNLREVKSVPKGYQVWPIGRKNGAEYSPDYLIIGKFDEDGNGVDFVKIRTERSGDIYEGVCFGYTLEDLYDYVKGYALIKAKDYSWYEHNLPKMKIALEAMRTIHWD